MDANKMKVEDFLGQNKTRFMIPVYQRNYDWSTPQCEKLFNDILTVGRNKKENTYFIGSIVYIHDDVYMAARIKELSIIDGQQRLTTLTVIYIVLSHWTCSPTLLVVAQVLQNAWHFAFSSGSCSET